MRKNQNVKINWGVCAAADAVFVDDLKEILENRFGSFDVPARIYQVKKEDDSKIFYVEFGSDKNKLRRCFFEDELEPRGRLKKENLKINKKTHNHPLTNIFV